MLKKEYRLKKNRHYKYIYKHGENKQIKNISMVFNKTKYQPFKIGFSVSNKIGKSVVRNKVKRRLRAAFNLILNNVNTNYNYIFVARKGIEEMTMIDIKSNIIELLKKAKLYNENT